MRRKAETSDAPLANSKIGRGWVRDALIWLGRARPFALTMEADPDSRKRKRKRLGCSCFTNGRTAVGDGEVESSNGGG